MHFRLTQRIKLARIAALGGATWLVTAAPFVAAVFAGVYQYPVDWSNITYPFGAYAGSNRYHLADDAAATAGTPVFAAADGTVVALENWASCYNYGGLALIAHDNLDGSQVVTLYGHLDGTSFAVEQGQTIARGSLIGYIGTSQQNGCWPEHIHYGIRSGPFLDYYEQNYYPFPYAGYGDSQELANWEDPTTYTAARTKVVEVTRVPEASPDRYATAAGVSAHRFPAAGSANQVLLGSGTNFVDALAATSLVEYFNASLLLTKPEALPEVTQAELQRVLPAGKMVTVLGGSAAVSDAVVERVAALGYAVQRIDGRNRAATAAGVANLLPSKPARAMVVNDSSFADAVSAGTPAAGNAWPVLLTKQGSLSPETRSYFEQHPGVTTVAVLGGETAVSAAVEQELREIPSIKNVERLGGRDRYETNVVAGSYLVADPQSLVVATGANFADALAGGALAAHGNGSLVLTKPAELPAAAVGYVEPVRASINAGYVLGGSVAVDPSVDAALAKLLNQPLTGVATVDPATSTGVAADADVSAATWTGAATQSVAEITVPVPDRFSAATVHVRGAQVTAVMPATWTTEDASDEEAPPLVVTRLALPDGASPVDVVASWLGLAPERVTGPDLGVLPGFFPAYTRYEVRDDHVLLIEARGSDAAALAAYAASVN